jgi:hypothetical protein
MEKIRQVIFYKDYFLDFYNDQTDKVKDKLSMSYLSFRWQREFPLSFFNT